MNTKMHMIDQKHKHTREVCLGQSLDKPEPYPRWIESVFWVSTMAVFAVTIMGFMYV